LSNPRIIAGKARGMRLKDVPGEITRPITDRVKEALFNILGADIESESFLDLFAGTGSVGIEALSRGAEFVRFIDIHKSAIIAINSNLERTQLKNGAEVKQMDAFTMLYQKPDRSFGYIFIAPPQYKELWQRAMYDLDANPDWVIEEGWVIVQIDPVEYSPLPLRHFKEFDQRRYGSTLLVFYEVT
jgi:16S rRNA (guanine966-N2)-methyltransferase